jgi:tRNA dimethylallyltransferase
MTINMNKILVLVGPTASGKTALALALADYLPAIEIISADAVQVFCGMDVGTAKPTEEERKRLKHHLMDVLDPAKEHPTAGWFFREARKVIKTIQNEGGIPLIVGGSGLYVSAALEGIAEMPEIPQSTRDLLDVDLKEKGLAELRRELAEVDPPATARIAPRDVQRTLRALEVFRATGIPLTEWQRRSAPDPIPSVIAGLEPPREALYNRIDERLEAIFNGGLEEEVQLLLKMGLGMDTPVLGALGYRHYAMYLLGLCSREQALRQAKLDTRHYAKRQMTYFRSMGGIKWFSSLPEDSVSLAGDLAEWYKHEAGLL